MNNINAIAQLLKEMPREDKNKKVTPEEVAEYLVNNNVVVLPCKIGSTVWVISKNSPEPFSARFGYDDVTQFNKRVFLTRDEAFRHLGRGAKR